MLLHRFYSDIGTGHFLDDSLAMDPTKNYCSECTIGWLAVGNSFLAIPISLSGLIIWAIYHSWDISRRNYDTETFPKWCKDL